MSEHPRSVPQVSVRQLRVVVEVEDYEEAVRFYRDVLGMPERASYAEGGDDRVAILEAGRATLELATPTHRRAIDRVEAVGRPSARVRLAFEVEDTSASTAEAVGAGADVVAEPVMTPWRSINSRLRAPGGLEVTLFQETEDEEVLRQRPGFTTEGGQD